MDRILLPKWHYLVKPINTSQTILRSKRIFIVCETCEIQFFIILNMNRIGRAHFLEEGFPKMGKNSLTGRWQSPLSGRT